MAILNGNSYLASVIALRPSFIVSNIDARIGIPGGATKLNNPSLPVNTQLGEWYSILVVVRFCVLYFTS